MDHRAMAANMRYGIAVGGKLIVKQSSRVEWKGLCATAASRQRIRIDTRKNINTYLFLEKYDETTNPVSKRLAVTLVTLGE